jgi:uncharacterized membrane protein
MTKFTQIRMDAQFEKILSRVLRMGMLLSALLIALGGVLHLLRYGMNTLNYDIFQSKSENLQTLPDSAKDMFSLQQCGLIQVGLLILLMTPILRVAFSAYTFAKQRDFIYLVITSIVLAVLIFSLFNPVV